VLDWIKSQKVLPTFVQRCIDKIRAVLGLTYRYVPSAQNVADIPSCSSSLADLQASIWFTGLSWLSKRDQWPPNEYTVEEKFEPEIPIYFAATNLYRPPFGIKMENYSDLMYLLRVTGHCATYLKSLATKSSLQIFQSSNYPIAHVQYLWIKGEQEFHYADVVDALRHSKHHELVRKLGLFLSSDGIIRCAHRLKISILAYNQKFPILLPKLQLSYFSRLLVLYFHGLVYHQGTAYTLNAIRKEFWLPQG